MDFEPFDQRKYRTLGVRDGYGAWSQTYEASVEDEMDLRLLRRIRTIGWTSKRRVLDLACGTGRIGAWLREQGIAALDGVDFTPEMLARAQARGVYRNLRLGDIRDTGLPAAAYDLVTEVLADEHLPELAPLYREAWRLAEGGGDFVIVGYHSHFLMSGIPTHFDSAGGEPLAIRSHVHLLSDHVVGAVVQAGRSRASARIGERWRIDMAVSFGDVVAGCGRRASCTHSSLRGVHPLGRFALHRRAVCP